MISIILPNRNEERLKQVQEAIPYLPFSCQVVIATDNDGEGKGAAIREGLRIAEGETIIFLDSDFDIHPRMINRLLPFLDDYDIVVGTKNLKNVTWQRKILTTLSRIYIGLLFGTRVETQVGLKVFKRSAIPEWKANGYIFDVEVLYKAKQMGKRMIEIPIKATVSDSKTFKDLWTTFKDTIKIRWFLS
jgi:glycosyltransferase involved in cell wall biosynthesis